MAAANEQRFVFVAEDRTKRATEQVKKNLGDTAAQGRRATNSFRNFRGASQQLGFQIQDVAVQLQGGTSAAQVFGQQGSQIASIFGPGGAVIGALIAVGAAVAGPFISSIFGGTNALKEMNEAANDVAGSLFGMTETQRDVAIRQNANLAAAAQVTLAEAISDTKKASAELTSKLEGLSGTSFIGGATRNAIDGLVKSLVKSNAEITSAKIVIESVNKANAEYAEAQEKANEALEKNKDPLIATNALLKEQIATFGLGAQAVAVYRAALDGVVTAEERNNIALAGSLDKLKADKKEKQDKAKQDKDLAKQKKKDSEDAITNLDNQLEASARMNKSMFALNKAVNIAQAIMDTRASATLALKTFPPPFGQIAAAANIAFGLQQVAAIKSASFEGGGFTGMGARSGGIDGRGGFLATLHPNESVIDHTKGQGGGITVINNVDARGSGADVDQKIKAAMAQTSQQTIMTIQDLMRRRRFA